MAIDKNADFTPSIPDSDVVPTKLPYNTRGGFKFWAQKVIPLVYNDSLSYYEVLCKVVNYLNNVIQNVDNLNESVNSTNQSFETLKGYVNNTKDTLINTYNELQNYVNTYFDNLDVQEEINAKLDAMADSGELTNLLAPFIPDLVTQWLNNHVTPTSPVVDNTLSISGAAADAKVSGDNFTELKKDLSKYRIGSEKYQSYYKHTLDLIVGYYNNSGELVEYESGWRTTEKLSTTAIPSLSISPSHCQIWKNGNYIGQYNYADFGSLPAFDTIVFTWNKNNVPASGIVLTPIGETYTAIASLEDEVSEIDDSVVEMGDEITANKQDFDDFVNSAFEIEEHKSQNLLNPAEIETGCYYWTDGKHTNASYNASGLIPVEPGVSVYFTRGAKTVTQGRAYFYVSFLVEYGSNGETVTGSAKDVSGSTGYTPGANVAFIRISDGTYIGDAAANVMVQNVAELIDYEDYVEPYTTKILKAECNNDPHIQSIVNQTIENAGDKLIFTATSDLLSANTNLICCNSCDNKKNEYIELTAKFSEFEELTIAHGKGSYMGCYITITASKLQIYTYNGTLIEEYDHGLTIADFINVIIYTKNDASCRSSITIMSSGGDYTANTTRYYSSRGAVLCNATFAMTDVQMKYTVNDAKEDVWVFGDSYISMGDPNRWATQTIESGHTHFLLCGYGGAMSMNEIVPFRALLDVARPKFIIWALGMNDGDTISAVNTDWKTCVDEVIATCEAKGITLILATIPNVPNVRNTFKNDYVKSTGLRYVDFAKAVNAESAGATWYVGMLSSDNTHPTALGAKALMRQFLQDVPEVLYAED